VRALGRCHLAGGVVMPWMDRTSVHWRGEQWGCPGWMKLRCCSDARDALGLGLRACQL
jgi:hypothetical protein